MKRFFAFAGLVLALGAVLAILGSATVKSVRLVSLDWPPYIGSEIRDGSPMVPNNGYVAEIVIEAFKRVGYSTTVAFRPWERAVAEATQGIYDGLFPEYYGEERKTDFIYSDPFPGGPVGLMKRKDSPISFKTLQDLKGYRIGVVSGYINTAEFDAAAFLTKDEAVDDETNLRKLIFKRIDLIFIDRYVGEYLVRTSFPEAVGQLEFMEPALEVKPLYIVFSKKAPGVTQKIKDFNQGLALITADGTVAKIMEKRGFSK